MATQIKLFIVETRMLQFMQYVISISMNGVSTQKMFCEKIGMVHTSIAGVRKGVKGFTTEHILQAHKSFGIDINWLFGTTDVMFPTTRSQKATPIELLKNAVADVETMVEQLQSKAISGKKAPATKKAQNAPQH